MKIPSCYVDLIRFYLNKHGVTCESERDILRFLHNEKTVTFRTESNYPDAENTIPDTSATEGLKLAGVILSRLGLNERVFARDCVYQAVDKTTATDFLDKYHLLNSTKAAYNRGLYHEQELLAVASFSKGRKMRRLSDQERSFELIRFCCVYGISVSGGLSKLVKNFCREKKAGDIMSYIDTRLSDGRSFANAGFEKAPDTESTDKKKSHSSLKMIYSCKNKRDQQKPSIGQASSAPAPGGSITRRR